MSAQPISTRCIVGVQRGTRVRRLRIEWGISRRALGSLAPDGEAKLITLRYACEPDRREQWSLIDPGSQRVGVLPGEVIRQLGTPGLRVAGERVHVHSPLLYAFVSIENPHEPELLYARTPVFGLLGIPGGRYQPLGASVELD